MVFPVAEAEVASEDEEGDGLEGLTVPELRERGLVLGVVPVGTDRDKRRSEPWVEALRVARATAQHTAAVVAAATAATRAAAARARERLPKQQTRPTVLDHGSARSTWQATTAGNAVCVWTGVTRCR